VKEEEKKLLLMFQFFKMKILLNHSMKLFQNQDMVNQVVPIYLSFIYLSLFVFFSY